MKSEKEPFELAVIGGGIAGAASALRAAQYGLPTSWIQGDKKTAKRSRSQWVRNIDNMLGVHPQIVLDKLAKAWKKRPELLEALAELPELEISTRDLIANAKARIEALDAGVEALAEVVVAARKLEDDTFELELSEGSLVRARQVILATGGMDRQPAIAKAKGEGVQVDPKWIYPYANRETVLYCIRCEGHLTKDRPVGILGAGEAAGQIALMLHERYGSACCILTHGQDPSWSKDTQFLLDAYGIAVHPETVVDVQGHEGRRGELRALTLAGGKEVPLHFALVAMGMYRFYNQLALDLGAKLSDSEDPPELRRVEIDAKAETNVPGLFVVGDLAKRSSEPTMMQIYTAQEYAVRAVDSVDRRRRRRQREVLREAAEAE